MRLTLAFDLGQALVDVHRVVLEAFLEQPLDGEFVRGNGLLRLLAFLSLLHLLSVREYFFQLHLMS